jgi:NAD+ synthase (glutamine-hydrolysing)
MKLIKVAAAVLNQLPLDWAGNQRRIVEVLRQAREAHVGLVCLPELCISGYGCEDAFLGAGVAIEAERVLGDLLPETRGMAVSIGLPVRGRGGLYSGAALAVDGRLAGVAAKQHLAGDGIHYEPRWFKPWPAGRRAELELLGGHYPVGDLVFEIGGVRVGFEICEDAWVAARPGAALAIAGVDVILNPSASHFAFGKLEVRKRFVLEGSRAFGSTYVYANLLGNEAGRAIYDGGALIASGGRLVAEGRRFGYEEGSLVSAQIDLDVTRTAQARVTSFQPDPTQPGDRLVAADFAWPGLRPERAELPPLTEEWERGPYLKEEEFLRAEALALFDYLRKSGAQGFVVSLSGGCDSSSVACLVALSARLARRALGPDGIAARLGHIPGLETADERALVGRLLTTVYQATAQSSEVTRTAARNVAAALGARHLELDVDPLVEGYVKAISAALDRPIGWKTDDLALQNIQARARGPGVWLVANLEGKLLLTTSNRSEAAAGYATMDGDTCGGLAPLAGIDKAFLRRWLSWLGRLGPEELRPALQEIMGRASTPELRPPGAHQRSEEDLMPFELLDAIERLAIRDKLSPLDVWVRLRADHPEQNAALLATWIERFFGLFARNQWKRERYAPSFHLDDENLDPKTWCRFPILSAGFTQELAALRKAAGDARPRGGK